MIFHFYTLIAISTLLSFAHCTNRHRGKDDSSNHSIEHVTEIEPASECTDGAHQCTSTRFQVCVATEWSALMPLSANMTCTSGVFANRMTAVNSTRVNLHHRCSNDQHYCEDSVFRVCVGSKWSKEMDMEPGMSCRNGVFATSGAICLNRPAMTVAAAALALLILVITNI